MTKKIKTINKALKITSTILFNVSIFAFPLISVGKEIAFDNKQVVSNMLGQPTSQLIKDPNAASKDNEYFKSAFDNVKQLRENSKVLAETVEAEGAVLLKNKVVDNKAALPLAKDAKVSLYSANSVAPVIGAHGSASIDGRVVSFLEAFTAAGMKVNTDLYDWYVDNLNTYGRKNIMGAGGMGAIHNINEAKWENILTPAKDNEADAAIFVLSRTGGEAIDQQIYAKGNQANVYGHMLNFDYKDGNYLKINDDERDVLTHLMNLKEQNKVKNVILLLNTPNQVECEFLDDFDFDAVLWSGSIGSHGSFAIGDILVGNVNPSGRLPDTYWKHHYLNPVHANFGILADGNDEYPYITQWNMQYDENGFRNGSKHVVYQEGIYSGYRYTETRYEDTVLNRENVGEFNYNDVVTYPFGYGESYTTFEYSNFKVDKVLPTEANGNKDVQYVCSVDIKNTGAVAGKETAQIYLQKPYTQYDIENHIEKASVELVNYGKTKILQPGQTETVSVVVNGEQFASYDAYGAKTYILDAGDYYLTIGRNAHDATNNILAAKGKTTADNMDSNGNAAFTHKIIQDELDIETYSHSLVEGHEDVKITNHFDNSDLNIYDTTGANHVDYITRNNWNDTVKFGLTADNERTFAQTEVVVTDQMVADMLETLNPWPEESKGGDYPTFGSNATNYSLVMLRAIDDGDGDPTNDEKIPYDDPMWDALLDQLTWEEYASYFSNAGYGNSAIPSISKPYVPDRDGGNGTGGFNEDCGLAVRKNDPDRGMDFVIYPSNTICAATFNQKLADYYGRQWGEDCLWCGVGGLYGISLDMHRSPYGGRNGEYFSECPILTGKQGSQMAKGMATRGVYTYNKHAILNEQESYRCGSISWCNEQAAREIYLRPFELTAKATEMAGIMTSLNNVGTKWAGCHDFINKILRDECGMRAHVVTDSLNCHNGNFGNGLFHGNDLPLGGFGDAKTFDTVAPIEAGGKGEYGKYAWEMREAMHRCLYTIVHGFTMNGISATDRVVAITPPWMAAVNSAYVAATTIFSISAVLFAASITLNTVVKIKEAKSHEEK